MSHTSTSKLKKIAGSFVARSFACATCLRGMPPRSLPCASAAAIFLSFLFAALVIVGCGYEQKPYHTPPNIELKGAGCVKSASHNIKLFMSGEANAAQVQQIWPCFSYVLSTFNTYVKGAEQESYSSVEIRDFIEKHFLDKNDFKKAPVHMISDAFLDELMGLKVLFLGGSRTAVTKSEIRFTFDFLEIMGSASLELLPHTPILFGSAKEATSQKVQEAALKLNVVVQKILHQIPSQAGDYPLSSLERFLSELDQFLSDIDSHRAHEKKDQPRWSDYVPPFAQAKKILLNSSHDRIIRSEWPLLGEIFSQLYGSVLTAKYFLGEQSFASGEQFSHVNEFIEPIYGVLNAATARRNKQAISLGEMTALFEGLEQVQLLPFGLSSKDMTQIWQLLTDRVLNPQNKYGGEGFNQQKLGYLYGEYMGWQKTQGLLYQNKKDETDPRWNELEFMLSTPWSVSLDVYDRVILNGIVEDSNLPAQTRINWVRSIFSVLYRAYIKDASRLGQMLLSRDELKKAYADLNIVLATLGLVERGDTKFDSKIFRDANLFMPRSNGNDYLEFVEVVEYLHFVFAGIDAGRYFVQQISSQCSMPNETFNAPCFRTFYYEVAAKNFQHLPLYLLYVQALNPDRRGQDLKNIEIVNRTGGASNQPVLKTEAYEIFVMLQYLEVIMLRFDSDHSGDLDLKEALRMLKLFKRIISDLIGLDAETQYAELEALFTYILHFQEIPDPSDPLAQLKFNNWKFQAETWQIRANRGHLLKLLAIIQGMSK